MKRIFDYLWLNQGTRVRFILIGVWNTIFGYLIFVLFDYLFALFLSPRYIAYMAAAVISNMIAVTNAYFFHRHFTFKSKTTGKAAFREYIRFCITYIVTFILSLILLPVLVELLLLDPKIAAAIITGLLTIVSYVSHNHFTFRRVDL